MWYWIAGALALILLYYAFIVFTARPDPYQARDEDTSPAESSTEEERVLRAPVKCF